MIFAREVGGADLGDARLSARARDVAMRLLAKPGHSLPQAMGDDAALEGAYRLLSNRRVDPDRLLEPHLAGTAARVAAWCATGKDQVVLVPHDTTELSFGTKRKGLGPIGGGGDGFFAHVSLAVQDDAARTPLGIAALSRHVRTGPPKRNKRTDKIPPAHRESARWREALRTTSERLGSVSVVHLMDSEGDAYLLLEQAVIGKHRFVIRAWQDRNVTTEDAGKTKLFTALDATEGLLERDVLLSTRVAKKRGNAQPRNRNLPRQTRAARLQISASTLTIAATESHAERESITLNAVYVREVDAPPGEEAVSWVLYTTEPVETTEDVARVVDWYRARWRIEELFKALKTGCEFEKLQLESSQTIFVALSLYLPVACDLLALQAIARAEPDRPASSVLGEIVLLLLQNYGRKPLPRDATVAQAHLAIARLGGHLRQNGPPGWLVLARGYRRVLDLAEGMLAGMEMFANIAEHNRKLRSILSSRAASPGPSRRFFSVGAPVPRAASGSLWHGTGGGGDSGPGVLSKTR